MIAFNGRVSHSIDTINLSVRRCAEVSVSLDAHGEQLQCWELIMTHEEDWIPDECMSDMRSASV